MEDKEGRNESNNDPLTCAASSQVKIYGTSSSGSSSSHQMASAPSIIVKELECTEVSLSSSQGERRRREREREGERADKKNVIISPFVPCFGRSEDWERGSPLFRGGPPETHRPTAAKHRVTGWDNPQEFMKEDDWEASGFRLSWELSCVITL